MTILYVLIALAVGFVLGVLFRNRAVELAKREKDAAVDLAKREADAARAALAAKIKP